MKALTFSLLLAVFVLWLILRMVEPEVCIGAQIQDATSITIYPVVCS